MPIVFVKGGVVNDGRQHSKNLRASSSQDLLILRKSKPCDDYDRRLQDNAYVLSAKDMKDVYDLKVIKISATTGLSSDNPKAIVIGHDLFFDGDDTVTAKIDQSRMAGILDPVKSPTKAATPPVSLLQKIRFFNSTRKCGADLSVAKELRSKIDESNMRRQHTRAGNSISSIRHENTVEDTVSWALMYAETHESSISQELIELSDELDSFIQEKNRFSTRKSSAIHDDNPSPPKSHRKSPVRVLKSDGPATLKQNGNGSSNAVKNPVGTLSQRLDKLGNELTADFVNAICEFNKDTNKHSDSRASIRSTFSGSINSKLMPTQPSRSTKASTGPSPVARKLIDLPTQPQRSTTATDLRTENMTTGAITERQPLGLGTLMETVDDIQEEAEEEKEKVIVAQPSIQPTWDNAHLLAAVARVNDAATVASKPQAQQQGPESNLGDVAESGEISANPLGRGESMDEDGSLRAAKVTFNAKKADIHVPVPPEKLGQPTSPRQKKAEAQPVKYSNSQNIDTDPANLRLDRRVIRERERMKQQFDRRMQITRQEFKERTEAIISLQEKCGAKTARAQKTAGRVFRQWMQFKRVRDVGKTAVEYTCNELDFKRPNMLAAKLECFPIRNSGPSTKIGSLAEADLLMMDRQAAWKQWNDALQNLVNSKWFVAILVKIKETTKKSGLARTIPIGLFKFLIVMKFLLMLGFDISVSTFYLLVESTINIKEDHRRGIVHKTLKACRDHIGIGPEEFLRYLEKNDIQPCTELVTQIRTMKRQKARKTKVKKNKQLQMIHENSTSTLPPAQSVGGSMDAVPTSLAEIKLVSGSSRRSGKPRDASSRRSSFSSVMESETFTDVDGTDDYISESNDNWDESDKDDGESDYFN